MTAFLIAAGVVGWCVLLGWTGFHALEEESKRWGAACVGVLIVGLAICLQMAMNEDESGPCLKYETGYTYNAATKTTMPYRYCAERGEWVK